jgi:hypothetical protein
MTVGVSPETFSRCFETRKDVHIADIMVAGAIAQTTEGS